MTTDEYDIAQAYSIRNRREAIRLFQAGQAQEAYAQHITDALAVPMTFEEFCEVFPQVVAAQVASDYEERHARARWAATTAWDADAREAGPGWAGQIEY